MLSQFQDYLSRPQYVGNQWINLRFAYWQGMTTPSFQIPAHHSPTVICKTRVTVAWIILLFKLIWYNRIRYYEDCSSGYVILVLSNIRELIHGYWVIEN